MAHIGKEGRFRAVCRLCRCPSGDGAVPHKEMFDILAQHNDEMIACIEIGALEARHVKLLTPQWWHGYAPKPAEELAACLLADISWRAHPDYRGLQALNVIAHSSFVGITHPGRAFIALTNYYRFEGLHDDGQTGPLAAIATERLLDGQVLHRQRCQQRQHHGRG